MFEIPVRSLSKYSQRPSRDHSGDMSIARSWVISVDRAGRELDDEDVAEAALAPRRERDPRPVGRPRGLVRLIEALALPHDPRRRLGHRIHHRDHALGVLVHRERDLPAIGRHRRIARAPAGGQPHDLVRPRVPAEQVLERVLAPVLAALLVDERAVARADRTGRSRRSAITSRAARTSLPTGIARTTGLRVAVELDPHELATVGRVVRLQVALARVRQRAPQRPDRAARRPSPASRSDRAGSRSSRRTAR